MYFSLPLRYATDRLSSTVSHFYFKRLVPRAAFQAEASKYCCWEYAVMSSFACLKVAESRSHLGSVPRPLRRRARARVGARRQRGLSGGARAIPRPDLPPRSDPPSPKQFRHKKPTTVQRLCGNHSRSLVCRKLRGSGNYCLFLLLVLSLPHDQYSRSLEGATRRLEGD